MIGTSRKAKIVPILILFFLFLVPNLAFSAEHHKEPIEVTPHPEANTIEIETAVANYLFSREGGSLRSVFLHFTSYGSKVAELIPATTTDPETLNRSYTQDAVFPGTLQIKGNSDQETMYELDYTKATRYDRLEITFTGQQNGLEITKTYIIHNDPNYTIELDVSIKNASETETTITENTRLMVGSRISEKPGDDVSYLSDPSVKYIYDGEVSNGIFAEGSFNTFGGAGFVGKDLVLFMKHGKIDGGTTEAGLVSPVFGNGTLSIELGKTQLGPQESQQYEFSLYAGRRRHVLLSNVGLGLIDDIGFFSRLLVPVIGVLHQLYKWTGNYGWAIIIFTIIIRVLLYPLMRNMYYSMAKMQELQPKMEEIREKYDEDKKKQQEAMMELYQEEGVNPMGGCLPMFVQLPILILLWRAILYSAEQIHLSPGFMWLPDLSLHDPFYILVVLTVGTMILQQQLMQTPGGGGGGGNKWLGYVFPIFMGVMLHNFPAGLWLYYFLTTLFQVGQQYFINWEMERAEAEQPSS